MKCQKQTESWSENKKCTSHGKVIQAIKNCIFCLFELYLFSFQKNTVTKQYLGVRACMKTANKRINIDLLQKYLDLSRFLYKMVIFNIHCVCVVIHLLTTIFPSIWYSMYIFYNIYRNSMLLSKLNLSFGKHFFFHKYIFIKKLHQKVYSFFKKVFKENKIVVDIVIPSIPQKLFPNVTNKIEWWKNERFPIWKKLCGNKK